MTASPPDFSVQEILRDLCERLEDLCDQQDSQDLRRAVGILEQFALENPRLEATWLRLQQALEADNQLLDALDRPAHGDMQ